MAMELCENEAERSERDQHFVESTLGGRGANRRRGDGGQKHDKAGSRDRRQRVDRVRLRMRKRGDRGRRRATRRARPHRGSRRRRGEALQKNNGTMVPPTLDEAGIIIGASARLAGRGIVQGNGTIGDNRQVGLDEDANLVGGRRERGRRHRGHTPPRSRTRHRPAEGPGVERNCTPRAWRSVPASRRAPARHGAGRRRSRTPRQAPSERR